MIVSFADRTTEDLFHGRPSAKVRRLPPDVVRRAIRKLDMLNAASEIGDLKSPPGNRLEALSGDLQGFHSIRVNDQWRIIFEWTSTGPASVEFIDYHRG